MTFWRKERGRERERRRRERKNILTQKINVNERYPKREKV